MANEDDTFTKYMNADMPQDLGELGSDSMTSGASLAVSDIMEEEKGITKGGGALDKDANAEQNVIFNHVSGVIPKLHNIVATCNLNTTLNLSDIALRARNAEYNPRRFAAVIMRIRDPRATALIFKSGKVVCIGTKTEKDARHASRKYAKIIKKLQPDVKFSGFKVQNIVSSCDVRFPIRLEALATEHEQFAGYEPELFPGLIYRMLEPKIVLIIFVSGRMVFTGAKSREDIYESFKLIYPILLQFKKETAGIVQSRSKTKRKKKVAPKPKKTIEPNSEDDDLHDDDLDGLNDEEDDDEFDDM